MMLTSFPSAQHATIRHAGDATPPLHQRLFGERSLLFYVAVSLWTVLMGALLVATVVVAPSHTFEAVGLVALPIFILLSGSPSRRVQAVALGIMGGLIWSHLDVGPLLVAVATVATGLANYVCAAIVNRDLEALDGLTRQQQRPVLTRLRIAVFVSWASVAVPGGLVVHGYLLERGWSNETAASVVVAGLALLAFIVWRRLADEILGATDRDANRYASS